MAIVRPVFTELGTFRQLFSSILSAIVAYWVVRSLWRLYFHPLSRYPGPKLAAISDAWLAYHVLSGRWLYAVDDALKEYGDIVRIAPNELVFATPQALSDLYASHLKNIELFPKTQINNHGNDEHGGLIWEWDPIRHRKVSKQLSPAFSGRALQAKEPTLHKYIDLFVERMASLGHATKGVDLTTWINWLCVDISADMAYNREMNALKNMAEPRYLSLLQGFNKAVVVIQLSWRFPLLGPLKYLFLLSTMVSDHSDIRNHSRQLLENRIRREGSVGHIDFFEQLIPKDREPPKDPKEMRHLEQVAGQLLLAGYEPPAMWFYFTMYYLLEETKYLETLTEEIRGAFQSYEDITSSTTVALPFLTACLKESLRLTPGLLTGMPVVSPGAKVDGQFIPRGVVCQTSTFSTARGSRYFADALHFRPERWLSEDHPLHVSQFTTDNHKAFQPFSQGPRMCSGREIAWWQSRLFVAKVVWSFDISMVSRNHMDIERDLRGWGMYVRPHLRARFTARTDS